MQDALGLLALLLLVAMNGFFVAAEFALVSVRATRIDQRAEAGSAAAKRTQRLLRHLDLYIAATQLGITMASLAIGFVAEPAIEHLLAPLLSADHFTDAQIRAVSFGVAFAISTILHIVFGELAPKSLALQRAEAVALGISAPLQAFTVVFRPIIWLLNALGNGVVRLFGLSGDASHHTSYSSEEIRAIVSASSQEGAVGKAEEELVQNVFELSSTTVRAIMTPRTEVVAIEAALTLREVVPLIEAHAYSRLPVYRGRADDIVGVLHTADLWRHLNALDDVRVEQLCRPAYFAPEGMRVSQLLQVLQARSLHLAVVVDEFGGMAGIATLEDALEELVGEIYDETDEAEVPAQRQPDGSVLVSAGTGVMEVAELLGVDLRREDDDARFDTLAGFLSLRFGYIPQVGEHLEYGGWRFTVQDADQRHVRQVKVQRVEQTTTS